MWLGDDDMLDTHHAAAYKYATVDFSMENANDEVMIRAEHKAKMDERMLSRTQPGGAHHLNDPVRPGGKSKKRRKKKKGSGRSKAASQRVPTDTNDYDYHNLDGSIPQNKRVLRSFDMNSLTHAEMMNSGLLKAIPSEHKHKKTYIQGLLPVSDMQEAGQNFMKIPNLRGAVSVDEKQTIHSQYPEWLHLRDNYHSQLMIVVEKVAKFVHAHGNITDSGGHHHSENMQQQYDSLKNQFLLLLVACRKVTLRIVTELEYQENVSINQPDNDHVQHAVLELKRYLVKTFHDLDTANESPFIDWTGISLSLNPLASEILINGHSAGAGFASTVLEMPRVEKISSLKVNKTLMSLYEESLTNSFEKIDVFAGVDMAGNGSSMKSSNQDTSEMFLSDDENEIGGPGSDLKNIMTKGQIAIARALKESRDKKVLLLGKTRLKNHFRAWRKAREYTIKIADTNVTRRTRNLRACFESFVRNVWQCINYRALQTKIQKRVLKEQLEGWKQYTKWCLKFLHLNKRSTSHALRYYFEAMKDFTINNHDVRIFRRKNNIRVWAIGFNALKHNMTISKYELRKRLEQGKSETFLHRCTRFRLFQRWKRRNELIAELDDVEEMVELKLMKDALVRFYLNAHGPRSLRFQKKMKRVKEGFGQQWNNVKSGANYVGVGIKALVATIRKYRPTKEMIKEKEEKGENTRRLRLMHALEFADNIGNTKES
jgi:hypothetical protein